MRARPALSKANLSGANLITAILVDTDLTGADLTGCYVYGVSAWGLKLERAKQHNLIITGWAKTNENKPEITVDNIEVAQFVYLLLHNEKLRDVIDTIGKKGVLLLGRFTEGRMVVLERLREKLRDLGFVPMVFNFDKPKTKDFTETVRLLCNLSHFVIVDITNPRSVDADLTPSDLAFALEHLTFNRNGLSTLRLDRGVRDYIVRQCAARRIVRPRQPVASKAVPGVVCELSTA
jgi:uncharacterized protein YjbI with pentapeptide repeats